MKEQIEARKAELQNELAQIRHNVNRIDQAAQQLQAQKQQAVLQGQAVSGALQNCDYFLEQLAAKESEQTPETPNVDVIEGDAQPAERPETAGDSADA